MQSMSNLNDLDALVPADKEVQLGGFVYKLPGDLPLEVYLRVNAAGDKEEDDERVALDEMVDTLGDLFVWLSKGTPEYGARKTTVEGVLRSRGIKFLMTLLTNIYKEPKPEEEDPQTPETPAST